MQKVLRINLNARNQGLKKARRANLKDVKNKWYEHETTSVLLAKEQRNLVKLERKNRREDWIAGPLAPKRDVGAKQGLYGTVNTRMMMGPELPESAWKGPKGNGWDETGTEGREGEEPVEWTGYGNEGNIALGDRVCVVRGHASIKGKLGRVKEIHRSRKEITIEGVNMVCLHCCSTMTISNSAKNIKVLTSSVRRRIAPNYDGTPVQTLQ